MDHISVRDGVSELKILCCDNRLLIAIVDQNRYIRRDDTARGTSSEIFRPESLRTIGADSIPAAEQIGSDGDSGTTSAAIKTLTSVLPADGLVTVYAKVDAVVARADGTNFRLVN
jgi:hypothetical protein